MRTILAIVVIALAVFVGKTYSAPVDIQNGDSCEYVTVDDDPLRVRVIDTHPMGTGVIGAIHISGFPYTRIVPRDDLRDCH